MEGDINWTTVAISWLFSTTTTFAIVYLAFHVKRCCERNRTHKHYDAIKGLANNADMAEWYSDKPLKTSSPRSQRSSKQDETIRNENGSKKLHDGNTFHKILVPNQQKQGITYRSTLPKEESILRRPEKRTLLTSNMKPSQTTHKSSATESCIKSISIQCMNPSKDCQPLTLIQTLTYSPTEKRRQSNERLKTRRASAHAFSEGNVTDRDDKKYKTPSNFQLNFCSAAQINAEQVGARRPPRPNKLNSATPGTITKGLSTGHFEFRSGSNSPPPILLPLTASTPCKRGTAPSQSSISKSLSSDTFPLKGFLSGNTNHVAILNQSDKVQNNKLPQTVLCNSSC